jgi:hypothetical protein
LCDSHTARQQRDRSQTDEILHNLILLFSYNVALNEVGIDDWMPRLSNKGPFALSAQKPARNLQAALVFRSPAVQYLFTSRVATVA